MSLLKCANKYLEQNGMIAKKYHTETWIIDYVRSRHFHLQIDRMGLIQRNNKKIKRLETIIRSSYQKRRHLTNLIYFGDPDFKELWKRKLYSSQSAIPLLQDSILERKGIISFLFSLNDDQYLDVCKD